MDSTWIKDKDNQRRLIGVLIGMNLIAVSFVFFMTSMQAGPIYEHLMPKEETHYYTYLDYSVSNITIQPKMILDADFNLTLHVIPLDENQSVIGDPQYLEIDPDSIKKYSYENLHTLATIDPNSTIAITEISPFMEKPYVRITEYSPIHFYNMSSLN